ncbi:MAG: indole-3-glycerol-phosphate synthase [Spirochaetes bacterium]|nr:indole-3-glycerol-phosphate synthase [Spirochaetota bacterium]
MTMYLNDIIAHKRREVPALKLPDMERTRPVRDPARSLRKRPLIAEIKKCSPSRGELALSDDITNRALAYERGGAGAVSVLTDGRFFRGSYLDLAGISRSAGLPVLCKDFILAEVQVDSAYLHGADFILLIAAVLNVRELMILTRRARRYSMKVLYEIHDADEMKKIKGLDPELVGVNSRNLTTFEIDYEKAARTISSLRGDFLRVAESGIETPEDMNFFRRAGADAFLVGTALMTAGDPEEKVREFCHTLEAPCS